MSDNLHPGTTDAHIEAAFGGEAPDCRECDQQMEQVDSSTWTCENRECELYAEYVDANDAYPDPYDDPRY